MQSVFRPLRALLIFDNVEEATAKTLYPGGDTCVVIATTRNKGLLNSLDIPEAINLDLERFDYKDTKEILGLLIGDERVEGKDDAIKKIHDLVGGLPLALRIVGGSLTDQPYAQIDDYVSNLSSKIRSIERPGRERFGCSSIILSQLEIPFRSSKLIYLLA